jgi:hypothetical protein
MRFPSFRLQIHTTKYGAFEIGPIASTIAVLAGLSGIGNFILNLGTKLHLWQ